nr:hypothetical protein [Tanacetum cinerariifolium]
MRRVGKGFSGVETPLFESMLAVRDVAEEAEAQVPAQGDDVQEPATEEINKVKSSKLRRLKKVGTSQRVKSSDDVENVFNQGRIIIDMDQDEGIELNDKAAQQLEIVKLKAKVKKLEKINKVKSSKLRRLKKVGTSQRVKSSDDVENVFNQGRIIIDMDQDEGIELVAAASTPISGAKPKILTITTAPAVSTRRRKRVVIRDPEEELHFDTPAETPKVKDKGKGILIEAQKPIKKKDQIELDAKYHGMKKKPQTESEARKNMIFYLKNTKVKRRNGKEDEEIIKSINETPTQKAAKRRKLSEEAQEAGDLRTRLEIVQDEDDDVFVEATLLAQKVPVVDYQIVVIDNKPKYKIIRADDTHQFYISFTTLLKNFDREDIETLWRIVRDRFSTSKPTNFSDEYLLLTLKTMFKKLDGQDAIWRNQKSVHGLALVKRWKLLTSCGVHVITLSTV